MSTGGKIAFVMLGMRVNKTSVEELTDELEESLKTYKLSGFKEDKQPIAELMSLQMKFANEIGGNKTFDDLVNTVDKVEFASKTFDKIKYNSN